MHKLFNTVYKNVLNLKFLVKYQNKFRNLKNKVLNYSFEKVEKFP